MYSLLDIPKVIDALDLPKSYKASLLVDFYNQELCKPLLGIIPNGRKKLDKEAILKNIHD